MKMNIKTLFGFAAVAGLLVVAAPTERAQALSLINPGLASSAGQATEGTVTEVRWRRHHGWHRHHRWHRHHGWRHRHHRHWR